MIVMVAGLPGSGKSFVASRLSDRIGAKYINSDQVRKSVNFSQKYSYKDKFLVYEEMVKNIEKWLHQNESIVVDATFYRQELRQLIYVTGKKYSTEIYIILVQSNENLIKERLNKFREDSEADFEVYKQVKDEFEEITKPHLKLESKRDNIDQMLEEAVIYLKNRSEGVHRQ